MRTLAIDLGTKRVGLALSDEGGKYATPWEVLNVGNAEQATKPILELIAEERVKRVVIGLPLNMDGSVGPAAKSVLKWAKLLNIGDWRIVFVDERLSSFAAEQQLTDRKRAGEKLTRKRKKEQLDAVAAAGFLQEFLDRKLPPIDIGIP